MMGSGFRTAHFLLQQATTKCTRSGSVRRRSIGNSATSTTTTASKQRFCLLDLRKERLSVIERLCLEECILRHDNRQWMIFGTHDPIQSRFLRINPNQIPSYVQQQQKQREEENNNNNNNNNTAAAAANDNIHPCIIVMGIGGKPELLLDINKIKQDGVWVIKRFSGGGTVVVDRNCLYTTIIGRNGQLVSDHHHSAGEKVKPYPREIMDWTATDVFQPTFELLKQHAINKNPNLSYPDFHLRENDYVLGETQKVAGNAQSIVKSGFLHHTTFLWTYHPQNMQYLTLPAKRPEYRKDRSHSNFLIQLQDAYHNQLENSNVFFDSLEEVCRTSFDVEVVSLEEALDVVSNVVRGGGGGEQPYNNVIQAFFETKGRTRLIDMP